MALSTKTNQSPYMLDSIINYHSWINKDMIIISQPSVEGTPISHALSFESDFTTENEHSVC